MNIENYSTYFWIKNESASSGRIYVKKNNSSAPTLSIQYSTDLTSWSTLSNTSTTARYVTANAGQKVYFRATSEKWADLTSGFYYNYFYSASGVTHSVGGNIMSLLYGANFVGKTTFPNEDTFGIFNGLFAGDTNLISAAELVLPVTHIESTTGYMGSCCYRAMFSNCSNLEYGPQVDLRFRDINNPIELNKCMQYFIEGCPKLKTIHVCLQNYNDCFYGIFANATYEGLTWYDYSGHPRTTWPTNVTCVNVISMYLPTYDRVVDWQSNTMGRIYQVTDSQNRVIWEKISPNPYKYETFSIVNESSEAITITITRGSSPWYQLRLYGSTNKTDWTYLGQVNQTITSFTFQIPYSTTMWLRNDYQYGYWLNNKISSTGDFSVEGNILSLQYGETFTGNETIMLGSNTQFASMFSNSKLIHASNLVLPITLAPWCFSTMFFRSSVIDSPKLMAPTLVDHCYNSMFGYCSSINNVTCLATSGINTNDSTRNWLQNVSSTGTFIKSSAASWPTGNSGIPSGWTVVNQ